MYSVKGIKCLRNSYTETGASVVSEYAANNLNQYTSRTVPGYAAVRGHADADATVTVNEKPTYRYGEYFFGSDEFDNFTAPVNAALETVAVKSGATEDEPDEIASVTNSVYLAKSPVEYEYDDDGNQTLVTTKTGTWRVTYNGENRPVRWERLNSSTLNSNTPSLITMSFDHQGRRREYLEVAADGTTNRLDRFAYDNYVCIARNRWQPDGTSATDRFVWDPTEPIETRPLVFYQPNAQPQLYSIDGNKNVSELVSASDGSIYAHYEYAPFGEVILSSGDFALANSFRFSSEYADDALGLVYYNYRHYEPMTGRWMSRDPIGERGGIGLYSFVGNLKSMIARDRLGLVQWAIDGIAFTLPEFFTETPAEKKIYKYVNVNAEYSRYKSGIHYRVRFIPRFSRPPDIDKEYGGRTPDGNSSLGGDKDAFQPDELEGDMPSDYWGDPEVTDYTEPDGWKQKSFRYKNKKFRYGYFVFLADLKERKVSQIDSNDDMFNMWFVDRTSKVLDDHDIVTAGDYSCDQLVFVLYGDRGSKPQLKKFPRFP